MNSYSEEEIKKYIGKSVLCIRKYHSFESNKFYEIKEINESNTYEFEDEYLTVFNMVDNDDVNDTRLIRTHVFHIFFELITKKEIRVRKINSIIHP